MRFDNTVTGINRLLEHLVDQNVAKAVCKSTGGYQRPLVSRLRETEIQVYLAHPRGCTPSPGPAVMKPKQTRGMPRSCPASAACSKRIVPGDRSRSSRSCRTCCVGVGSL